MSIELVLVETGEGIYRRLPVALPVFEVRLDGQPIGFVRRTMITHERRTPGKRYVNARWQSPGWKYGDDKWGRWEARSRRDGIEELLRQAGKSWAESEALAAAAKVIKR